MMRSFLTMYGMDIGIDTSRLVSMNMILSARKYPTLEDRAAFLRRIDEQFATVAASKRHRRQRVLPFSAAAARQLEIDGQGRRCPASASQTVTMLSIGSRYFNAIGVKPVQGRVLTDADGEAGPSNVVVNQRLVAHVLQGRERGRRADPSERRRAGCSAGALADRRRRRAQRPAAEQQPGTGARCRSPTSRTS